MKAFLLTLACFLPVVIMASYTSCATTPEKADQQARLLFAVAAGLDAAGETTTDADFAVDLAKYADTARSLAELAQTGGLEGPDKVLGLVQAARHTIFLMRSSASEDLRLKLDATYTVLAAVEAYYAPLPETTNTP